jgi:hypothetical protein
VLRRSVPERGGTACVRSAPVRRRWQRSLQATAVGELHGIGTEGAVISADAMARCALPHPGPAHLCSGECRNAFWLLTVALYWPHSPLTSGNRHPVDQRGVHATRSARQGHAAANAPDSRRCSLRSAAPVGLQRRN